MPLGNRQLADAYGGDWITYTRGKRAFIDEVPASKTP
jgi:hypothetical protein